MRIQSAAFRDPQAIKCCLSAIEQRISQPWRIMEICGGQTHSILRYGLDQLLPSEIQLIHGPGCPVCVTPLATIDNALRIAQHHQVIFCSFGDMLRVPGSQYDLLSLKTQGADVRIVYSPLDALQIAQNNPKHEVVFFAVGFETTAPLTALTAMQAKQHGIKNFSLLVHHVCVPPVINHLLSSADCQIQGFLAAGHVCTVTGDTDYQQLARQYHLPIVITGFEPLDLLQGIYHCIDQLERGDHQVINAYRHVARNQGNHLAQQAMQDVFVIIDQQWRGLGQIAKSGLALSDAYAQWNAQLKFTLPPTNVCEKTTCRIGDILQGLITPLDCEHFALTCTPERPLGATMVSSEGACAAYYRYRQY